MDHSRALLCELRAVSVAKKPLAFAAALTVAFTAAEFVGGIISGSLALIADAGHMLMDSAALVTACAAVALSARPPSAKRTYGLARLEVLSAFFSAMLCFLWGSRPSSPAKPCFALRHHRTSTWNSCSRSPP